MGKVITKSQNKGKIQNFLFYILISCVVVIIGIFIMSKKEGMDFDEIGTFGLANNTFQLDIEDFKEYSGEELLLKYAAVKDGEEFNVRNVFFNQKMDTHPPLYYLIVNFICSIRKGTFSMWYGLIINLFFMIILFWEMRYLFNLLIKDNIMSTIFSLMAFFTYGFVNEIVFIRMYVMLSVISMAFAIFVIKIIKSYQFVGADIIRPTVGTNKTVGASYAGPHIKTFIIFFTLCLLGILTQYHFMIIAFYFSLVLGIFLICKKDFKTLLLFIFSGVLAIGAALRIFPGMINHIFGSTSLHAFNDNQFLTLDRKFYEITMTLYRSFFGVGLWPYLIILLFAIIIYLVLGSKRIGATPCESDSISTIKLFFIFLLCCIFYYLVIAFTSKYSFARYLYNIYPLIIVCIISAIYLLFKSIKPVFKYVSLAVLIMLIITSRLSSGDPFSLNIGNNRYYEFLSNNREIKVLGLYRSIDKKRRGNTQDTSLWKLPRPLYAFRNMKTVSFADLSDNNNILYYQDDRIAKNEILFVVIYTVEKDDEILGGIMGSNGFTQVDKVFDNTYYHMYVIAK